MANEVESIENPNVNKQKYNMQSKKITSWDS
jgi:hypothetical protein